MKLLYGMELLYKNKDGSTTKYTEDMLIAALKERDELKNKSSHTDIANLMYQFFYNRFATNDSEIIFTAEEFNELFKVLGFDKRLKRFFTANGTINFSITDIEAESDEEALESAVDTIAQCLSNNTLMMDWSIEVDEISQQ
jgi:hypothetical protein